MTDKPILFSGPMVKAIIDSRKTMTRRVLKPQPPVGHSFLGIYGPHMTAVFTRNPSGIGDEAVRIPYAPGDLLWVRETWFLSEGDGGDLDAICYRADDSMYGVEDKELWPAKASDAMAGDKWRPSIFMPRWASRITLRVTAVKVERLQDISEDDAKAEGVEPFGNGTAFVQLKDAQTYSTVRGCFVALWTSINGPGAWDANPWVAAYSFERVKP